MQTLQMEQLVYLKHKNMLYKYIAYRPSKKEYILEKVKVDVGYSYGKETLCSLPKQEVEDNLVIKCEDYILMLKYKILNCQRQIDTINQEEINVEEIYDRIELLKYELANLNKKIITPTTAQEKAIKNLEKAIRRANLKKDKYIREQTYDKNSKIRDLESEISLCKELISISKKYKKKIESI